MQVAAVMEVQALGANIANILTAPAAPAPAPAPEPVVAVVEQTSNCGGRLGSHLRNGK